MTLPYYLRVIELPGRITDQPYWALEVLLDGGVSLILRFPCFDYEHHLGASAKELLQTIADKANKP
jgi:hypothetical protein